MNQIVAKIFQKNIQYNILSLFNVLLGFIFIILLGRKFGAGDETDLYFLSLVIIAYLSIFVRSTWSAIGQYYVELKLQDKSLADEIYNILSNTIVGVSLLVIFLYFIISNNFNVISPQQKEFLDIFIFFILLRSLINFNKIILNLEHYYAPGYFVDIMMNIVNLIIVIFFLHDDIKIIAYSTLIAATIALMGQWYLIYFDLKIKFSFSFFKREVVKKIYKNSFKINIGGLFYSSKDILIATVLTNYGSGVYSLFSYANKFVGVILQVVNAPIYTIFVTKMAHTIAQKDYLNINPSVKNILLKITLLYSLSGLITYFILPYILSLLFSGKFSIEEIKSIQYIFIFLVFYYLIVTIEGPYVTVLNLFKKFNYVVFVNFIFFLFMGIGFMIFKSSVLAYDYFFAFLIFAQLSNALLYVYKYKSFMIRNLL